MKVKVLKYADDGNTLVMPYKEIVPVPGCVNVFVHHYTEYNTDRILLVLQFGSVYIGAETCNAAMMQRPDFKTTVIDYRNNFLDRWRTANWIPSLDIQLHEMLGLDPTPLKERRAEIIQQRAAKEKEKEAEKQTKAKEAEQKEQARLIALFERFKQGERVSVNDFLALARLKKVALPAQTVGMFNKFTQTSEIGINDANLGGTGRKKISRAAFDRVFEVAAKVAAI